MLLKVHSIIALLVSLDYIVKIWAMNVLRGNETIILIEGLLGLTYVENRGAAFGIFSGKQTMLIVVSIIIICVLEGYLIKERPKSKLALCTLTLIIAGGLGNLIDRMSRGFVVDYLDINQWFSFPVFNLADCYVTVGQVLLICYIIFSELKESKKTKIKEKDNSFGEPADE